MIKKRFWMALVVIFPLVVGLACLSSAPDPTATPTEELVVPIEAPTEEIIAENAPTVTSEFQELVMLEKNFWAQKEGTVFISFFLENPNSDVIFEGVKYTIVLSDANGNEIESDYATIQWIYPNQSLGIVFNFYLYDERVSVNAVDITWEYEGTITSDGSGYPFSTLSVNFWENDTFPIVAGMISNNSVTTFTDIQANIICYNSTGEIVGGGVTYLDFVPAEDNMGFYTNVDTFGKVASVEVFPISSYNTLSYEGTDFWSDISILDDYFYEGDFGNLLGGAVIRNETDTVLKNSILAATFYDEAGSVVTTGSSYIDVLLPGDTLGISPWVQSTPKDAVPTNYDILVLPGELVDDYELTTNPFLINSANIVDDDFLQTVAVNLTNNYSKQVSEVDIYILAYNTEGQIIGGGRDWTKEPTPAGGTTEIEVWIDYASSQTLDVFDVWVIPSSWTEFD